MYYIYAVIHDLGRKWQLQTVNGSSYAQMHIIITQCTTLMIEACICILVIDKMETYIFGCLLNTFCVGSEFQVTFPLSVFWRCKFQQISEY